MYYVSTRDAGRRLTASQAIVEGLSRDGGLYLPEEIPQLTMDEIKALAALSYPERAAKIMKRYLDEFTEEELLGFAKSAYGPAKFDTPAAAPVVRLTENTYIQELWHGPTCAFKDMALQMLPYLLTASLRKTGEEKTVCILVATSGDTGKAALEGFRDVDRTKILVFYPDGGVSEMQKLQMVTQEGRNVGVCAVRGNFDDAQTGVKRIFSDEALREELAGRGYFLSSANSINWGRLLPQIVYYVSAYCDLLNAGTIEAGTRVNFCVPTGNFGNILSGFYAKRMGVPIGRLICASNENNVLTDFIKTGTYDRNRPFYQTASPSMDILISSNGFCPCCPDRTRKCAVICRSFPRREHIPSPTVCCGPCRRNFPAASARTRRARRPSAEHSARAAICSTRIPPWPARFWTRTAPGQAIRR